MRPASGGPRRGRLVVLAVLLALAGGMARPVGADEELRRLREIELEGELAQDASIYLVLDSREATLSIRVRALELDSVALQETSKLVFRPLFATAGAPPISTPAIWRVVEGPGDSDRETIAPTTLRPYSEDDEEVDSSPDRGVAPAGGQDEVEKAKARRETSYRVPLDNGWQLYVTDRRPELGWVRRFLAAVRDGWQRLRGTEPAHPPLIVLVVAPDDARRLHHVFRTGTPILVRALDRAKIAPR